MKNKEQIVFKSLDNKARAKLLKLYRKIVDEDCFVMDFYDGDYYQHIVMILVNLKFVWCTSDGRVKFFPEGELFFQDLEYQFVDLTPKKRKLDKRI